MAKKRSKKKKGSSNRNRTQRGASKASTSPADPVEENTAADAGTEPTETPEAAPSETEPVENTNGSGRPTSALNAGEIQDRVQGVEGWEFDVQDNRLVRDFSFKDFTEAMGFINRIAEIADAMDHHPEIYNVYNQVSLALMTHDVDGISGLDFTLAERINGVI